ncbi:MAG: hypothetical protein E3J78_04555 [Candidatus Cloacimonadota bacterium]|nr:MAG: hypothetical protein E3J78_04555 [Candidatus Cloacimonadota bacterium]
MSKKPLQPDEVLSFGRKNYFLFAAAILIIAVGYLTLSKGSMTLAPILLVLGYVILIPIAIIIK